MFLILRIGTALAVVFAIVFGRSLGKGTEHRLLSPRRCRDGRPHGVRYFRASCAKRLLAMHRRIASCLMLDL
jgi:hypothetical protein